VLAITDLGKERTWCWLPSPVRSPSIKAVSAAKVSAMAHSDPLRRAHW